MTTIRGVARSRDEGYVVLTGLLGHEGRFWVATCQELGTAAHARTIDQALRRLSEFVELHLNTLEAVGQREGFFKEHGIKVSRSRPESPKLTVSGLPPGKFATSLIHRLPRHKGAKPDPLPA